MRIGIMSDLAVGVGAQSAEAWTYGNLFAEGVSVGAPPDHFNQTGQDWGQAPWRPDRMDELSYAPFRSMVAGILRHSGGVRVDHIMGLFRLWWIPAGHGGQRGLLRPVQPRGHGRHPRPRGAPRRRAGGGGGPRRRRAVGARLPARARHPRHLHRLVRAGRRGPSAGTGGVAGVLPRVGHDPRPAADGRLPRQRAHQAAARARACSPSRWRRSSATPSGNATPSSTRCASAASSPPTRRRPRTSSRPCTATSSPPRRGCCAQPSPTPSATGGRRTSPARAPSTPTGRSRCPARTASR